MNWIKKPRKLSVSVTILVIVTIGSAILIVPAESTSQSNISNVQDGIWWAITTVTGVGYGDYFPTTLLGRTIGSILQVAGVTIFGLTTALLTIRLFRREQRYYLSRSAEKYDRIEKQLADIQSKLTYEIKNKSKRS